MCVGVKTAKELGWGELASTYAPSLSCNYSFLAQLFSFAYLQFLVQTTSDLSSLLCVVWWVYCLLIRTYCSQISCQVL